MKTNLHIQLIEKLQKVYDANIEVKNENFDMRYFFFDHECGTTACLVGNAIMYDPYFTKYGLHLSEYGSTKSKSVEYVNYVSLDAISNFFDISALLTDILFALNVNKKTALTILETTIKLLQNSNEPKLNNLLDELLLILEDDTIDYLYEFFRDNWDFVADNEFECVEEVIDFLFSLEYKPDVSFIFNDIYDYLKAEQNLPEHICEQFIERANAERLENGFVEIDYNLPTVFIRMSDESEYFFQEQEASELLDSIPDNIYDDDYLLAIAQNW